MDKKAIIFMDYNDTFDDVGYGKNGTSNVFISGIRQFCNHFNGNVDIAVITAASYTIPSLSIRSDLYCTLCYVPNDIRHHFKYLIEDNCQYLTRMNFDSNYVSYTDYHSISSTKGGKKEGVENTLMAIDSRHKIGTCIFVGDSENLDLPMIDAEIGDRAKYFILANKRVLKTQYPVYKLSPQKQAEGYSYGRDIIESIQPPTNQPLIIKTTTKSFGVGKGFQALTSYLKEREL